MTNLTDVGVTSGRPSSGTGQVSTIDKLVGAAGAPAAAVLTVQGLTGGEPVQVQGADGNPVHTINAPIVAKGYQQITAVSAAVSLTIPTGSAFALIGVEALDVRWRDDGINPTASVGMLLTAGSTLTYDTNNLATIKLIETSPGAILNIAYYGY